MAFPDFHNTFADKGVVTTEANRRELLLTQFSGDVLNFFDDKTIMGGRIRQKTISTGKSYQFPVTSYVQAAFHKPGTQITGQDPQNSARTISIDDILYSSLNRHDLYEALGEWSDRQEYAQAMANALAKSKDVMEMCEVIKAARSAATIPGKTNGGTQIVSDSFKVATGGAADSNEMALAIFEALFQARQILIEKNISGQLTFALNPQRYLSLMKAVQTNGFAVANQDYFGIPANLNEATLPRIAGFDIIPTNLLPAANMTATGDAVGGTPGTFADTPLHTNHTVDASKTIGIIWHPDAVGTVTSIGLRTKMQERVDYLGELLVSYFLLGSGVLRPECAIELSLDSLSN